PRRGGLAGAGRPPEDERTKRARGQHAGERPIGAEKVILADDIGKPFWPQTISERPRRRALQTRRLEQRRHRPYPPSRERISRPFRSITICHGPPLAALRAESCWVVSIVAPLRSTMTSPRRRPVRAASELGATAPTITPLREPS